MSPQKQVNVSSICLAVMILLIFAYGLLIFYVPVFLQLYMYQGEELSLFLKTVIMIGHVINKAELLVVPAVILGFIASLIWRIQSSIKLHQIKMGHSNSHLV